MRGSGCWPCAVRRRSRASMFDIDVFLARAREVHGDFYDYSRVVYRGAHVKLTIVCPEHGSFEQTANSHVRGTGCMSCGRERTVAARAASFDDFAMKARAVHGDLYDYSQVEYHRSGDKVVIGCKDHGFFEQVANSHLGGAGCPVCAAARRGLTRRLPYIENFIARAEDVHGKGVYDYSGTVYESSNKKISIVCREHGEFEQLPHVHLSGSGCPGCGRENLKSFLRIPFDVFVHRAREVHSGRYEYDEASYVDLKSQVRVRCAVHGWFNQKADNHLIGRGCTMCHMESFSETTMKTVSVLAEFGFTLLDETLLVEWAPKADIGGSKNRRYDIYLPGHMILIEVDGDTHRQGGRRGRLQRDLDRHKDAWAEDNGYMLLRLATNTDYLDVLREFLRSRGFVEGS